MKKDISNEQKILHAFKEALQACEKDGVVPFGRIRRTIYRANGDVEEVVLPNIVTKDGLNVMAANIIGPGTGANSAFRYLIIGTATAAGSLGSVQGGIGEVGRKIGNTIASSNEVAIIANTWQGAADGLTGIALGSAGITNHANSGSGTFGSHVNSVDATLAASDYLSLQYEIQVGSHNL